MAPVDWNNIKGDWLDISPDSSYPLDQFVVPTHYKDYLLDVQVPHGLIMDRINRMAEKIVSEDPGPLTVVCILKGGHQFFSDLVASIKQLRTTSGKFIPLELEFIRCRSYVDDSSTGNVEISLSESQLKDFQGKNILLAEDMIDSGQTMVALVKRLKDFNPKSVKVAALTVKKTDRNVAGYIPDYVGFMVNDSFLVGYALDYNNAFRDLDHICTINEAGKQQFATKK